MLQSHAYLYMLTWLGGAQTGGSAGLTLHRATLTLIAALGAAACTPLIINLDGALTSRRRAGPLSFPALAFPAPLIPALPFFAFPSLLLSSFPSLPFPVPDLPPDVAEQAGWWSPP